ncbi:hypothetical protein TREMEDRAFT_74581 [Tremella mesenterica DSM 1558]|uniref:uncharacterized protein n=1 Tax=Tremella mesenterica (strain ATCC 24925 / CBS 8224 / DSM 1558 / NBRC 9311 / NRRL Y-6157 / RJB 2259-6 / UBC 559-6) TaxID=578456 RepID=UPI0003F4A046|nr:uncharacterized protein TREMEDRAFT_74581 [Tremella mesenterica DSM 1558]EIW67435.1 hypothetical protein TREMEDRAFT_74581 [Tremella mesenterica DSM 1558]
MLVAVQGCSHGSLSSIYASLASYTRSHGRPVDLLLLCGDFQALRSTHDFASLAVPPKYHALGTFHEYYSGKRKAPVLTIVIGGNHEASNYMWELYHGGWLAEGIYYLGAGGSVLVNGLRIVGASGIYKKHDYNKGHFEKVPYDKNTLRSVYHTRQYDILKLMQLPPRSNTIVLSHDWPLTIPHHGNLPALLRRKPFFADEIRTDTLGSPPLLGLLKRLKPEYWFSAHLHVKFAAVYDHKSPSNNTTVPVSPHSIKASHPVPPSINVPIPLAPALVAQGSVNGGLPGGGVNPDEITIDEDLDGEDTPLEGGNPDEIEIDMDEDFSGPKHSNPASIEVSPLEMPTSGEIRYTGNENPDEILLSEDEIHNEPSDLPNIVSEPKKDVEVGQGSQIPSPGSERLDESVDIVEATRRAGSLSGALGPVPSELPEDGVVRIEGGGTVIGDGGEEGGSSQTRFLALDKCGPGKDHLQFLDIPTPSSGPPVLQYDPDWLAITRAFHPYLSTAIRQTLPNMLEIEDMVRNEKQKLDIQGVLIPPSPAQDSKVEGIVRFSVNEKHFESTQNERDRQMDGNTENEEMPKEHQEADMDERGMAKKEFWAKGLVEISKVQKFQKTAPAQGEAGGSDDAWYTNPQTEAFCRMLGIENKINPNSPYSPSSVR